MKKKGLSYDPVLWDHNDQVFLETWEKNKHFLVVGPKLIPENTTTSHSFECPATEGNEENTGLYSAPTDLGTFNVLINGKLQGKGLPNHKTGEKETKIWSFENYCVVYTAPEDYSYEDNNTKSEDAGTEVAATPLADPFADFEFTYMLCHEEKKSWCEKFTLTFHPIMLSISVIFLVITLIIYVCEDSLKTSGLFHKITIAFILNLTICFIVLIDNFLQDLKEDRRETVLCKLSGYGVMYFFLSFFFWINTMSFSIYSKFTNMSVHSPSKSSERKKLMCYSLYAQGVPLLIVIITMSIDSSVVREKVNAEDLIHYPNMGIYSCFLGAIKTASHQIYFGRPEFIYFQSFLLLIQISNLIFLGFTVKYLVEGFRNKAKLTKTKTG